jgi:hypothetical protein
MDRRQTERERKAVRGTRSTECLKDGTSIPADIHKATNLPDILVRWRAMNSEGGTRRAEQKRKRTEQSFCVPSSEIRDQDYDLSINRYKEVEYDAVQHDSPQVILQRLATLEDEIVAGQRKLEGVLTRLSQRHGAHGERRERTETADARIPPLCIQWLREKIHRPMSNFDFIQAEFRTIAEFKRAGKMGQENEHSVGGCAVTETIAVTS